MRKFALPAITIVVIAGLVALGVWQIERLSWKRALIAQVDRRLAAAPVPAPGPAAWPAIDRQSAYTRITVHGVLEPDRVALVQAVTDLGPGFWAMTPLKTDRGFYILVNRGFVPTGATDLARKAVPPGDATVTGLLRVTEPKGGFLRNNDPAADRWYSRDVAAIAAKRGFGPVAPYFIDADRQSSPGWPRGGLTVIAFPNNHLQYALTWFAMAALLAFASMRIRMKRGR